MNIAVCIDGGESAVITFTGVGYGKRLMGDTMNVGDASHLTGVPSSPVLPGQVIHTCDDYFILVYFIFCLVRKIKIDWLVGWLVGWLVD